MKNEIQTKRIVSTSDYSFATLTINVPGSAVICINCKIVRLSAPLTDNVVVLISTLDNTLCDRHKSDGHKEHPDTDTAMTQTRKEMNDLYIRRELPFIPDSATQRKVMYIK